MLTRIILLLFISTFSFSQNFCECVPAQLTKEEVKKYDAIFEGKVDSVGQCRDGKNLVFFSVDSAFLGKVKKRSGVRFICSGKCALKPAAGESWIIYGKYYGYGLMETDACTRSRKFFPDTADDYVKDMFASTFEEDLITLSKFGKGEVVNEEIKNEQLVPERKLEHPQGMERFWLYIGGVVGMVVIYFVVKKFL